MWYLLDILGGITKEKVLDAESVILLCNLWDIMKIQYCL